MNTTISFTSFLPLFFFWFITPWAVAQESRSDSTLLRLFSTPSERQAIHEQRQRAEVKPNTHSPSRIDTSNSAPKTASHATTIRISAISIRYVKDKAIPYIWINQQPAHRFTHLGIVVDPQQTTADTAFLWIRGQPTPLKIGTTHTILVP